MAKDMVYQKDAERALKMLEYVFKAQFKSPLKVSFGRPIINVWAGSSNNVTIYFETIFEGEYEITSMDDLTNIGRQIENKTFEILSSVYIDDDFKVKNYNDIEDFHESDNMICFLHDLSYNSRDPYLKITYSHEFNVYPKSEEKS